MKSPCKRCGAIDYSQSRCVVYEGQLYERCDRCSEIKISYPEFMPQRIKDERVEKFKECVQPYRGDEVSKEFIESNPKKAKEWFNKDQIKNAKYVWKDINGWSQHYKG